MKYLAVVLVLFFGCQYKNTNDINETAEGDSSLSDSTNSLVMERDQAFLDSLYTCECEQFISKLEEIPDKDSNAYRITITSTDGAWEKSKLINTRPEMSRITRCNKLYTTVSFACGGPCYSELFVFTEQDRPDEQYGYTQLVKNSPNIISHIRNEEFEKLILHNFTNSREMTVNISDAGLYNYGQMDSMILKNNNVILYYATETGKPETKTINIRPIL